MTEFKPTSGVYALVDPRTSRIMYIGQSVDVDYRYRQHMDRNAYDSNVAKRRWIEELRGAGLVPRLVILETCSWPESDEVERRLIRQLKARGQCELNLAGGGAGNRAVSKLTNGHMDDWFQMGLKVKRVRALLLEIADESYRLAGNKGELPIRGALKALDGARCKLDSLLCKAFPEWKEFTRVFYGPEPEGEGPGSDAVA